MNPQTNFTGDPFFDDYDQDTIRNFCSWLLNFKEYQLPLVSYAIAVLLSELFTIQERAVIGSIFSTIATNTFLIAAQQGFLLQVDNFKQEINDKRNNVDQKSLANRIKYIEDVLKSYGLI